MELPDNIAVVSSLRWHPTITNYFSPPSANERLGPDRVFFNSLPEIVILEEKGKYRRGTSEGKSITAEEFRALTGIDPETREKIRVIITPYSLINHQ